MFHALKIKYHIITQSLKYSTKSQKKKKKNQQLNFPDTISGNR